MLTEPFSKGKKVMRHIEEHGFKTFFVGGCVRDSIIGRPVGDIDIATSAKPDDLQRIFQTVIPVGIEHGTVIVRWEGESYEVTTFRLEDTYSDQRHPDKVEFVQTIDQDLKRRDFTMNAVAMDIDEKLVDPYNGRADIEDRIIRAVGNGYHRFSEDPLRIVRAIRFSSQLGFNIEKSTLHDMVRVREKLQSLAVERLAVEMTKLFAGEFIEYGFEYLAETCIWNELPVFNDYPCVSGLLPKKMIPLYSFGEVIAMLHCTYPTISITKWIRRWKASNKTKQEAETLTEVIIHYKRYGVDSLFAYILPRAYIPKFMRLAKLLVPDNVPATKDIKQKQKQIPIQSKRDLALNGKDLLDLFPELKKGPWIGELLLEMERAVVKSKVDNTESALRKWLCNHPPNHRTLQTPGKVSYNIIANGLDTKWLGKTLIHKEITETTQKVAQEAARNGSPHGTTVIADTQTKGKGRMGRTWHSSKDKGVWMSILLHPDIAPQQATLLTLLTATVLADVLSKITSETVTIKWPNDILMNNKKVAGILTEMQMEQGKIKYVIIGIGLNVNQTAQEIPTDIKHIATSLFHETNNHSDLNTLIRKILHTFEKSYADFMEKGFTPIKHKWESHSYPIGQNIRVNTNQQNYDAVFSGIDEDGALLVSRDGQTNKLYSAEIDWHNNKRGNKNVD